MNKNNFYLKAIIIAVLVLACIGFSFVFFTEDRVEAALNVTSCECSGVWCNGADINQDGKVGPADLSTVASWWGQTCQTDCNGADVNDDGVVNQADLDIVAGQWGNTCSSVNGVSNCVIATCADSDGGKDYYVKGIVSGIFSTGSSYSFDDSCSGNYVIERYCDSGNALYEMFSCPNGCAEGICKAQTYSQCADGIDNDGNGFIDYPKDPGCSISTDNTEESNFPTMYLPQMPSCSGNYGTVTSISDINQAGHGAHRDNVPENYSIIFPGFLSDGNALDWYWIYVPVPVHIEWDLNQTTDTVRVFPSQDHGPYPAEFNEFDVKVSSDRATWTKVTASATYVDDMNNVRTHDGVIDFTSTAPFRYVRISPNYVGGGDLEIDAIRACPSLNITCNTNSDCGINSFTGSPYCQNGNVYQNFKTFACNNPGTANSVCSDSSAPQLKTTCGANQTCSNGSCSNSCTYHYSQRCANNNLYWFDSCGTQQDIAQYCSNGCQNNACASQQNISAQTNSATNNFNNQATLNGYVYGINSGTATYVWFQWGTSSSYGYETSHQIQSYSGSFNQNIANLSLNTTYHFRTVAQNIYGNIVYGQDMTFTTSSTNQTGNLISVNKSVRNLSSGNLNWSSSMPASPSDVLMFMVTIRVIGNQNINNVTVRDVFPSNLIYKNQLVVSGANNYTGDINSLLSLGTILANQTVTITYQAQVSSPQYFSYGTTALSNNVSVNSFESNATSSASIVVTKTAVAGATSISTGLTNNFLADSFFLPLIIALIGVWLFKSDIFGFEKWADIRKLKHQEYKAEKELKARINQIRQSEKN